MFKEYIFSNTKNNSRESLARIICGGSAIFLIFLILYLAGMQSFNFLHLVKLYLIALSLPTVYYTFVALKGGKID